MKDFKLQTGESFNWQVLEFTGLSHLSCQIEKVVAGLKMLLDDDSRQPGPQLPHLCFSFNRWHFPLGASGFAT